MKGGGGNGGGGKGNPGNGGRGAFDAVALSLPVVGAGGGGNGGGMNGPKKATPAWAENDRKEKYLLKNHQ